MIRPLAVLTAFLLPAAFLGQAGVLLVLAGTAAAILMWRRERRRADRVLIADYVERHSFPSDSVADFVATESGQADLAHARQVLHSWRNGFLEAERRAHERRSYAARKAVESRRRAQKAP